MTTITIPKKLIKDDLVIIPRKKYEELLRIVSKKKSVHTQPDKDLNQAVAEYKAGKFWGPFDTVENGIKFLKNTKHLVKK